MAQMAFQAPDYNSHHFNASKWQVVNPRPDDIVIVTAYKSGTTWMQQIVSEVLFQGQEKPGSVGDISPWVDLRVPPAEVIGPIIEAQTHRRFLKTHLPADAFEPYWNPTGKYIYVGRAGRDAFMSLMNHYEKGNDTWYGALNDTPGLVGEPIPRWETAGGTTAIFDKWLSQGWHTHPDERDGWPFWSLFKNMATWWQKAQQHPDQILFVHFNSLKEDLPGEMRRIANFLGVPVSEALFPSMVQACTFEGMKSKADAIAPLNGTIFEGGGNSFIFKGTNGRWQGVLSDAQNAAYEQKLLELPPDCRAWLETGSMPAAVNYGGAVAYAQPVTVTYGAPAVGQMVYQQPIQQVLQMDGAAAVDGATFVTPATPQNRQMVYGAPGPVSSPTRVVAASSPSRINVSPEVFAKLAAGGSLTAEEMAQMGGSPAPAVPALPTGPSQAQAGVAISQAGVAAALAQAAPAAGVAGVAAGVAAGAAGSSPTKIEATSKKEKKDKASKKSSKKAMKASKKKEKGCC